MAYFKKQCYAEIKQSNWPKVVVTRLAIYNQSAFFGVA